MVLRRALRVHQAIQTSDAMDVVVTFQERLVDLRHLLRLSFPGSSIDCRRLVYSSVLPVKRAVAGGGIEPPTRGFSVHCSAD